ncbi:uncharacterized protein LOC144866307 [Branchiostoma floridae x Branchiostoma japonicum]
MDGGHKQLLKKHRVELVNNIKDVDSVLDHLVSEGVIEEDEEKEIKDREGGKAQVRKLLATLAEKQGNSFHSFCTALENSRHKRLADVLRGHGAKKGERVFIIHAGEDKAGFVEPLVQALQDEGLPQQDIFYDVLSIGIGDVIRSRIMAAMASESLELVVTVLSKNSLNHKYWPKLELETALRHNRQLFPVWLDDNEDDFQEFNGLVGKYCPTLKSIRGYKVPLSNTEEQVRKVAKEIVSKLSTRRAPGLSKGRTKKRKRDNTTTSRSSNMSGLSEQSSDEDSVIDQECRVQRTSGRRRKRNLEDLEKTPSNDSKKPKADPDLESRKLSNAPNPACDEKENIFHKFVERSEKIFHDEVLQDPDKFSLAVETFKLHADIVLGTDESGADDSDVQKPAERAKLTLRKKTNDEIARVDGKLFADQVLSDLPQYNRLVRGFNIFKATLRKATRGCVLCYLNFEDDSCYKTFLRAYRDGRLSDTLTRELITDDTRAAEGEDLYVHVTLLGADGDCQDDTLSDEGKDDFLSPG